MTFAQREKGWKNIQNLEKQVKSQVLRLVINAKEANQKSMKQKRASNKQNYRSLPEWWDYEFAQVDQSVHLLEAVELLEQDVPSNLKVFPYTGLQKNDMTKKQQVVQQRQTQMFLADRW